MHCECVLFACSQTLERGQVPSLEQMGSANVREVELVYDRLSPMVRYALLVAKTGPSQYLLFCNHSALETHVYKYVTHFPLTSHFPLHLIPHLRC